MFPSSRTATSQTRKCQLNVSKNSFLCTVVVLHFFRAKQWRKSGRKLVGRSMFFESDRNLAIDLSIGSEEQKVTIFASCCPVLSKAGERRVFFKHLRKAWESTPCSLKVARGDWNSHIGGDSSSNCVGRFTLQKQMSPGSPGLIEFMEETGACLINARCRRGTWYTHLNSCYYELDYFVGYRGQGLRSVREIAMSGLGRVGSQCKGSACCRLPCEAQEKQGVAAEASSLSRQERGSERTSRRKSSRRTRQDQGGKLVWICYAFGGSYQERVHEFQMR